MVIVNLTCQNHSFFGFDFSFPLISFLCQNKNKWNRISGGIGAVLDWWPIKAYRPCPNFSERGGSYTRSGQGLDEIAFGRDSKFDPSSRKER